MNIEELKVKIEKEEKDIQTLKEKRQNLKIKSRQKPRK